MELITPEIEKMIEKEILVPLQKSEIENVIEPIEMIIGILYANIPAKKRISYGIVHTIKSLSDYLYRKMVEMKIPVFETASAIFNSSYGFKSLTVALGILSLHALTDYPPVLPLFDKAAASDDWNVREISQMFLRKLIKKHPDEMHDYLLLMVRSDNAFKRRFVCETLRPVCENQWFYQNPEYSLSVIRHLFREKNAYPRTSAGNQLSDYARKLPEMVYGIVEELVQSGDKNSFWIACRACRNLVKKEPERVMKILGVSKYRYKDREYFADD